MSPSASTYWSKKPAKRTQVNPFARKVLQLVQKKASILDLGCGFGEDSMYFAKHRHRVTAVDFSEASVKQLRRNSTLKGLRTIKVLKRDISKKLPFPNNSFDVVYAHLSIHYFDDATIDRVLRDIERVLKPGGFFFVKCKSVDDPLYGKGQKIGEDTFEVGHMRHFFRKEYMQAKLHTFDVLSVRRTSLTYVDYRSKFIEAIARKRQLRQSK